MPKKKVKGWTRTIIEEAADFGSLFAKEMATIPDVAIQELLGGGRSKNLSLEKSVVHIRKDIASSLKKKRR